MAVRITIKFDDNKTRECVGRCICEALVGSPSFINNEIFVNYTDPNTTDIVLIAGLDSKRDEHLSDKDFVCALRAGNLIIENYKEE